MRTMRTMKTLKLSLIAVLFALVATACSDDDEPQTIYDVTYTVTAVNGATINSIRYLDESGNPVELGPQTSPWSIDLDIRGGLALDAVAFGDVPYQGELKIVAAWGIQGSGSAMNETVSLPNDDQGTIINNGEVRIDGRTLPRE